MTFAQVGACPKCGAPIWIPQHWARNDSPPPCSHSCLCHGPTIMGSPSDRELVELKKKVEALEKEVQELKGKAPTPKRVLLSD